VGAPGSTPENLAALLSVRSQPLGLKAALPGLSVDTSNAACLAQVAGRLDALPLAIELAAARVKLQPPQAMLPRLEHSHGVLVWCARSSVAGPASIASRRSVKRPA
jgi:predicted ATPase